MSDLQMYLSIIYTVTYIFPKNVTVCSVCVSSVPSNSRVLTLLGQLQRMNGEVMARDVESTRQVTAKILHLIQTQGERQHTHTHTH